MKTLVLFVMVSFLVACDRREPHVRGQSVARFEPAPLLARQGENLDVIYNGKIPSEIQKVSSVAELTFFLKVSPEMTDYIWPEGIAKFSGTIEIRSPTERLRLTADKGALRPTAP
jgi:hypothetical protein